MLRLWMMIIFVTAGFSQQVKAQGVDVIFWMDNSASIDATEWADMIVSTTKLIDQVLGCNPLNRVAVVHYAGTYTGVSPETPKIYIESDFTSNATTAKNFVRRGGQSTQGGTHYETMGDRDYASESLELIGKALDGTAAANIISTQKKLTKTANNKLVIFYFTDALRNLGSTWMVSQTNTANPFVVYNQFKTDRGATFVVLKAPSGSPTPSLEVAAQETAAAIASVGGSYIGAVESNAGDPQGSGVKPRKAIINSTFSIATVDISTLATNICKSCEPVVNLSAVTPPSQTVVLNSTAQNLVSTATGQGTLSYQWYSNTTNSTTGGTLITGATSATYTPPTSAVGTTYYYVVVSDSYCEGKATSAIVSVLITVAAACFNDPATGGTNHDTKMGITLLKRAGAENADNWPMVRKSGHIALESNTQGFVVTRMTTAQLTAIKDANNAVEGMMSYDTDAKCLKIYDGTDWKCFSTPSCP